MMKSLFLCCFLLCFFFTGCQEQKPEEKISVVHLGTSGTPSPTEEISATPEPTNTPTPEPTSTPTPTPAITEAVLSSTPIPATPTPVISDADVLTLINDYRVQNHCQKLTESEEVSLCAAVRLAEMTGTGISHTRPDGTAYGTVFQSYGVSGQKAVELIYEHKQLTPQKAFDAFTINKDYTSVVLDDWSCIGIAYDRTRIVILFLQQ